MRDYVVGNSSKICPCKNCTDRGIVNGKPCHSSCSGYKEYKATVDAESAKIRKAKAEAYSIPFHKPGIPGYRNKITGGLNLTYKNSV